MIFENRILFVSCIFICIFIQMWPAFGKQNSTPKNFAEIRRELLTKSKSLLSKMSKFDVKATSDKSISTLKNHFRRKFFRHINVCYNRFKHCSIRLSPEFCASPNQTFSFYIWAKQYASDVMTGMVDGNTDIKCSDKLIWNIMKREQ